MEAREAIWVKLVLQDKTVIITMDMAADQEGPQVLP
jgi:hypothetical protein